MARRPKSDEQPPNERTETTSITISVRKLTALEAVALVRKAQKGGRASVSAVIDELIDDRTVAALEREGAPFLDAIRSARRKAGR